MLSAQGDQAPGAEQQKVAGPAADGRVMATSGCAFPCVWGRTSRSVCLDSLRVGKQLSPPFQKQLST